MSLLGEYRALYENIGHFWENIGLLGYDEVDVLTRMNASFVRI